MQDEELVQLFYHKRQGYHFEFCSLIKGAGDEVPCREHEGVPRFHFFLWAGGPHIEL